MKKILIVFMAVFFAIAPVRAEMSFSIAAVVNEDVVSDSEVQDRMKLAMVSSGLRDTKEIRERILPQVIGSLVEEQLKMQEAARNDIVVSQEEIDEAFSAIAGQNNMKPEQFANVLQQRGIPTRTLRRQLESQIAWSKVVSDILRPQIDVSQSDVDSRIQRLRSSIGKTEFLAAEIFLPVEDPAEESKTRQLAERLTGEIKDRKAPFQAVAAQFSKAAGADQGGSLGWVQEGQLPKELDDALQDLSVGDISDPVRGVSGFHILLLREQRTISEENLPSRDDVTNKIGFERLDRLQQRHLSDLKAAAFIERRV